MGLGFKIKDKGGVGVKIKGKVGIRGLGCLAVCMFSSRTCCSEYDCCMCLIL